MPTYHRTESYSPVLAVTVSYFADALLLEYSFFQAQPEWFSAAKRNLPIYPSIGSQISHPFLHSDTTVSMPSR